MITERELNIIRGTIMMTAEEESSRDLEGLLDYVEAMENLLDKGDMDDMYGTEGWRHRIGMEVR